jgi:hypothetical protein
MEYTKERQQSDLSFLVGASYGRETERARWIAAVKELAKTSYDAADLDELLMEMENK